MTLGKLGLFVEATDQFAKHNSDIEPPTSERRAALDYIPPGADDSFGDYQVNSDDIHRTLREVSGSKRTLFMNTLSRATSRGTTDTDRIKYYRDEKSRAQVFSYSWLNSLMIHDGVSAPVQTIPGFGDLSRRYLKMVLTDKAADIALFESTIE